MNDKGKPAPLPQAERRAKPRKRVLFAGVLVYGEGHYAINCRIRDLTEASARVALPVSQNLPEEFYFINMKEQTAHKAWLVWRNKGEVGLVLETAIDLHRLPDPKLVYLVQIWSSRNTVSATWK
jgi:hypothetical protein